MRRQVSAGQYSKMRNSLLRLFGLVLVTGGSWFILTADWLDPRIKFALVAAIAVYEFLVAFRDDSFIARCIYLAAGLLTIIILVVVTLLSDFRGEVTDWMELLARGGSGFLTIAVATSVILNILELISVGHALSEREMRFGHNADIHDYLLTVPAGIWGIPVGVATAVLVGLVIPGQPGIAVGLVSGIGTGALAWNSSVAGTWGLVNGRPGLYQASSGAALQVASVVMAVIASIIIGASEMSEFVASKVVPLIFTFLITGVLTQVLHIIQVWLASRLPVMALSALTGGALGVAAGLAAGEQLVGDVSTGWMSNTTEIVIVVLIGAAVALVFQRLGVVIGFTASATIVAISGGSFAAIAATGAVGAIAGLVLAVITNVILGLVCDNLIFRFLVLTMGITASVAAGVHSGLPVPF